MTVICPNCGGEIAVPKKKTKSIKCPHCDMAGLDFGLDYFDEEDNPKKFSLMNFASEHPKTTKATIAAALMAGRAIRWWMKNKDLFTEEPTTEYAITPNSVGSDFPEENVPAMDSLQNSNPLDLLPIDSEEAREKMLHYNLKKRRLPENQRASVAKREEANRLGIDIGDKYTLVDPYDRPYRKKQEA